MCSDEQTEDRFLYLNGGAVTYRNWNAEEPNSLKNEDCAIIQDSRKWNNINCSNSHALIKKKLKPKVFALSYVADRSLFL